MDNSLDHLVCWDSTINNLVSFGRTGNVRFLRNDANYDREPLDIDVGVAMAAIDQLLRILHRGTYVGIPVETLAWNNLAYICDDRLNANADLVRKELVKTPFLDYATYTLQCHITEATHGCMYCLCMYSANNCDKRRIWKNYALVEALITLINECSARQDWYKLEGICAVFLQLLQSRYPMDDFILLGGVQALGKAVHHVLTCSIGLEGAPYSAEDDYVLNALPMVLETQEICYMALMVKRDQLERSGTQIVQFLEISRFLHTIDALHTLCNTQCSAVYSAMCFVFKQAAFLQYLVDNDRAIDVLLYRGKSTTAAVDGVSLIVQIIRILRGDTLDDTQCLYIGNKLDKCWALYPAIRVHIMSSVGKVRTCAYPGCKCTSLFRRRLRRCARCLQARYCDKGHQIAHWKSVHKYSCVAFGETPTVDQFCRNYIAEHCA